MTSQPVVLTLRITCENDADVSKVIEKVTHVAAGLALDGVKAIIVLGREENEDPCAP